MVLTYSGQCGLTVVLVYVTLFLVAACILLASIAGAKYDEECKNGNLDSCKTKDTLNDECAAQGILAGASLFAAFAVGASNYAENGRMAQGIFLPFKFSTDGMLLTITAVSGIISLITLSRAVAFKSKCTRGEVNSCEGRNNLLLASTISGGIAGGLYLLGGSLIFFGIK